MDLMRTDRRGALRLFFTMGASIGAAAGLGCGLVRAADDLEEVAVRALKPGTYAWHPERAPEGLVVVVVSLPDQRAYVYRDGMRIGVSTVSTGRAGYATPTGVFTILAKDVDHHSSVYDEASMPYSERLTWSGVALHAGGLPGYPSSHGCVHLPLAFAKLLFSVTQMGTPVIIADTHSAPADVLDPGLVLTSDASALLPAVDRPASGPVAMVASGADQRLVVLRAGTVVLEGGVSVRDPSRPLGNVVYLLKPPTPGAPPRWTAVSYEGGAGAGVTAAAAEADALSRLVVEPAINQQLGGLLAPGSTLLVTDLPAHPGTRSGPDFVVITPRGEV